MLLLVASWTRMKDLSKWFDFLNTNHWVKASELQTCKTSNQMPWPIASDTILSQNWYSNSLKWNLMHFYGNEKEKSFSTNLWKFVTTAFDTRPLFSIKFISVICFYQIWVIFSKPYNFHFTLSDWDFLIRNYQFLTKPYGKK